MNVGRLTLAVVATGGLGVAAGGIALATGGHSAAAGAPTSAAVAPTGAGVQAADSGLLAQSGGRGQGGWGDRNGRNGRNSAGFAGTNCGTGANGQVTGVNISGGSGTINLTSRRSTPVTVTVSATTVYTQAQQAATSNDVHVGSRILACGTGSATSVQASQVYIVLPSVAGVVTNVNGSTLTLTGFGGRTFTVTVGAGTTYDRAGGNASLTDITNGTAISAQGTQASNGTLNAVRVEIQIPRVAGQVTKVSGSTITLSSPRGGTTTVVTSPQTTYSVISGTAATANAVQPNTYIIAQGTLSSDGKTLNALRITVLPATNGAFPGRRGHGGHGFGGRGFAEGDGPGAGGYFGGRGGSAQAPSGTPNAGFGYRSGGGWNGASPDNGRGFATANA